jgi:uncharacterized membrane protein YvbJ
MYNYSPAEAGKNLSTNNYDCIQEENKTCTLKKCLVISAIISGAIVVFVAGYLVRNYFPNDAINDFLNNNNDNHKNITERLINTTN